jgi:hypothetical protein
MLGINRSKFLELLAREKIALYDPSPDELAEEFQTASHLAAVATAKK